MTYNIRHGVGLDGVLDLERTARVIRAANPDIIILNEVDQGTARSYGVHQADSLGSLLDLFAVFGRSIDYDGGQYGNALLSRYPILDFQIIDLSTDSLLEGRSVFLSQIDVRGDTLTIMGTHLGLSPQERWEQVERIIEVLPDQDKLILAGDFNFAPTSHAFGRLTKLLRDGLAEFTEEPPPTFLADKPDRRIDYLFIGKEIEVVKTGEFQHPEISTTSDHLPQILHFR
ncbi:MAG: endonuclease/exonuclease/phosphatase family protein [FCB group bacterium]|nr:endonuclease/exonuclease/phosphatase family protein [FCB group bacterium]MBL7029527.1 endonuclease/exonuclease/phosphatase family protein [Candidatus Neomarinimicrobiota bacterium]MBL7121853.1 endonuclease/exonuclease/phosphatase family protein [Candidatus Neomarinimicrobiota bacterium]